jgi:hypothetical protein
MKRLLLLLMLVSPPAWAGWVEVGRAGGGETTERSIYLDPATIRKTAEGRRAWRLYSFVEPQPDLGDAVYQSTKALVEYDCAGERTRDLQFSWHSGQMGTGRTVKLDDSPSNWSVVSPRSVAEALLKAVCKVRLK